jgi:hypothetical protein
MTDQQIAITLAALAMAMAIFGIALAVLEER